MKKIAACVIGLTICISLNVRAAGYSGGSGTEANPYLIATPADMNTIGANSGDWDKCFKLVADINMAAYTGTRYKIIGTDYSNSFTGTFDGDGHVIKNLTYTSTTLTSFVGLFGYTYDATIKNLGVEDVNIDVNGVFVGGLIGKQAEGTLTNCYSTGSITSATTAIEPIPGLSSSSSSVGGLIGQQNYGTITDCYSTSSVNSTSYTYSYYYTYFFYSYVGGLIGKQDHGNLTHCYSTGSVTSYSNTDASYGNSPSSSYSYVGGLIGYQSNDTFSIVYPNNGTITDCYSTGSVTAYSHASTYLASFNSYVGGLIGKQDRWNLTHCYSTGLVTSYSDSDDYSFISSNSFAYVGGLIGQQNYGTVTDCCCMGSVNSTSTTSSSYYHSCAGGLIGQQNYGTVTDCCCMGSVNSTPTASSSYAGGLIGEQDHGTLTNCYSTGSVTVISDSSSYAGGLIGYQYGGTAISCYSTGSVTAISDSSSYAGGLIGCQHWGTAIICYSTGSVASVSSCSDSSYVVWADAGGLIGYQYGGTATNCYSTGAVTTSLSSRCDSSYSYAGGLVGHSESPYGIIENCYSTGIVSARGWLAYAGGFLGCYDGGGILSSCCWDVNTSRITTSDGGSGVIGKTTALMKTKSTFTNAGWDFSNTDGNDAVWRMCVNGVGYPKLNWESSIHGDFGCPEGTDLSDLTIFINQWLYSELNYDLYQTDNQHIVNFRDFNVFANSWDGDYSELANFMSEWLEYDAYNADIAGGDGFVNFRDFAVFAENWMKGENNISEHVTGIEISTNWDHGDPDYTSDNRYEFEIDITTDNTVQQINFVTPNGSSFIINKTVSEWNDSTGSFYNGMELDDNGSLVWGYGAEYVNSSYLSAFGDGEYVITIYYTDGASQQTTVWFGIPRTSNPMPQPTQKPVITSFNDGDTVSSPVSFVWQACTDSAANLINLYLVNEDTDEELEFTRPTNSTGLGQPIPLEAGSWDEVDLGFIHSYNIVNEDGIPIHISKVSESEYGITVE